MAAFVPFVRSGNLLFSAGHIAKIGGKSWVGQLGAKLTTAQGKAAARAVAIDLMGTLHAAVSDLNEIKRIVKLMVLVNSTPEFTEQHLMANGASELFGEIFGERDKHVRSSFGVVQIARVGSPDNAPALLECPAGIPCSQKHKLRPTP